jgi:N-acetylglucosaminyldiphosphoundecaprenol N-acetyl-beta-D-mannosaminyltransferase
VIEWATAGESRYVCIATVNNVMEAHDDPDYLDDMNGSDLTTPDGMPLVWGLKRLGVTEATRVYGPDLTPVVLDKATARHIPVGFYGGAPEVLAKLVEVCRTRWPGLEIRYAYSPPFRPLSEEGDKRIVDEINSSGARILFVGLGCPKQETWMATHRGHVRAAMLGVGAAFDFLTGSKKQAPGFVQRAGLEWLFRLMTEPRRLWRRYLRHNPRFVALFGAQIVRQRFERTGS